MKERITYFSEPKVNTSFAQSMLTHAGLWNLQKCELYGSFCLFTAVGTLPITVKALSLHALAGPTDFLLSAFQRFTNLESLSLAYYWEEESAQFWCDFVLDCVLENLSTSDLLESGDMVCGLAPRCTLVTCLPNLTKFKARFGEDKKGIRAACDAAALPCLQELRLLLAPPLTLIEDRSVDHRVLLNGDPKLVVASTQPMKQLYWHLVQSNVSFFVEATTPLKTP